MNDAPGNTDELRLDHLEIAVGRALRTRMLSNDLAAEKRPKTIENKRPIVEAATAVDIGGLAATLAQQLTVRSRTPTAAPAAPG